MIMNPPHEQVMANEQRKDQQMSCLFSIRILVFASMAKEQRRNMQLCRGIKSKLPLHVEINL